MRELDYFYGYEAEQFSFIRFPKILLQDSYYNEMTDRSKILYGLMLDRMALSRKNGWIDDENRVFIIYTYENIMQDLNCAKATCAKAMSELCEKGLISKERRGQGNPDIIYIKNFVREDTFRSSNNELPEVQKLNFKKFKNETSRSSEIEPTEVQNVNPNNTDINKTNNNYTDMSDIDDHHLDFFDTNITETVAKKTGYAALEEHIMRYWPDELCSQEKKMAILNEARKLALALHKIAKSNSPLAELAKGERVLSTIVARLPSNPVPVIVDPMKYVMTVLSNMRDLKEEI